MNVGDLAIGLRACSAGATFACHRESSFLSPSHAYVVAPAFDVTLALSPRGRDTGSDDQRAIRRSPLSTSTTWALVSSLSNVMPSKASQQHQQSFGGSPIRLSPSSSRFPPSSTAPAKPASSEALSSPRILQLQPLLPFRRGPQSDFADHRVVAYYAYT
ncbi:hypothetical protein ZWY2020_051627 [Hordeum vulgare]|nr:hypothetical protein ZWY2020_051627 [Hordeum vulgare]